MKKIFICFALLFFLIAVLIFRPVPIVTEDKAIVVKGNVSGIYESGIKDVSFKLKDNPTIYYINRGLENGLHLDSLKAQLIGEEVTIKYPSYWTPLDWDNRIRHLSKLEWNGEVIFNELKPPRN